MSIVELLINLANTPPFASISNHFTLIEDKELFDVFFTGNDCYLKTELKKNKENIFINERTVVELVYPQ